MVKRAVPKPHQNKLSGLLVAVIGIFVLPVLALGYVSLGPLGAIAGASVSFGWLLSLWIRAEKKVEASLQLRSADESERLRATRLLNREVRKRVGSSNGIAVKVVQDPKAFAFVARGLMGPLAVYVSQGLLLRATESELVEVARSAAEANNQFSLKIETLGAALLSVFRGDSKAAATSTIRGVRVLVAYPYLKLFFRMSGRLGQNLGFSNASSPVS